MPGMQGLDVAARIRKDVRFQNCTIVMVTSEPEPTPTPRNTLDRPYDGWVNKPFDPKTLKDRVLEMVNSRLA